MGRLPEMKERRNTNISVTLESCTYLNVAFKKKKNKKKASFN